LFGFLILRDRGSVFWIVLLFGQVINLALRIGIVTSLFWFNLKFKSAVVCFDLMDLMRIVLFWFRFVDYRVLLI